MSEIEVLNPERLTYWCEFIDLPAGATAALHETAVKVNSSPDLTAVFQAFYDKTVVRGEWHREWIPLPVDPLVERQFGESASLFYLLAYVAGLPKTWSAYQLLGVGSEIFQATMLDFRFNMEDYFEDHGRWGFAIFTWMWRHMTAELFRLGRLQYMLMPFAGGVRAFRRREGSAEHLLLADPEMPLREDGYAWGAGRPDGSDIPPENEQTWRPIFEVVETGWRGHLVSAEGRVAKDPVLLSDAEWELALQPGDTILDLHVPRKDVFNVETCAASYSQALEFFAKVFPDHPHKAMYCWTWVFSPQLQKILPPSSNLVRFQRQFLLYPIPGTIGFLKTFVFKRQKDISNAPRDTSLRRAVLDWVDDGGEIFELAGLKFYS